MYGFIKRVFIGLLIFSISLRCIINTHDHVKCKYLKNQQSTYYTLPVILYRCMGSCNTFSDISNRICVQNTIEDLSLSVFNRGT